ncbi:MAG TPA: pyrroline-5-carboxylate reductase [Pirellulaceae bacterium]|nr:pyrroline-5-carboxylate reductase [Pirellulaceae bacterium]
MTKMTIGFIGAGQMARALARGFVAAELVPATHIVAFDPVAEAASQFAELVPGSQIAGSNQALVEAVDVAILAVKPQCILDVMRELAEATPNPVLFVSIIAGTPLAALCAGLKSERVVRVMPNTPCLIGAGAAGYSLGPGASTADGELVGQLLGSVGIAFLVPETQLDAVTGLSGSGPAYVYTMIEALSDGGVRAGLPRAMATALAAQTVFGAAQMVISTGEHPGVLKDRVTSPGGTTIAGLQVLERNGLRSALIDAVEAATKRSQELGQS